MPAAPPEPGFGHGRRRSPRCRPGWATALGSTGYPRKLSQWDGANICSHTYIHMHMKDIYIPNNPPAVIGVGGGGTPPYRGRGDAVPTALGPGKSKILDLFRPNCSCNTNRGRFPTCPKCHATVAQSQRPWARENPNSRIYSGQTCKSTLPRAHFRGPRISVKIPRPSDRPFPGAGACPPRTAATGAERC